MIKYAKAFMPKRLKMAAKKWLCLYYFRRMRVAGIEESLNTLIESKKSLARIGDGEFSLICRTAGLGFQKADVGLSRRLTEVLRNPHPNCLIGVPDTVSRFENLTQESENFWIRYMYDNRHRWLQELDERRVYLAANLTRPYIRYRDRTVSQKYFDLLKKIWNDEDILIIEGRQTGLGVGNDLFQNAKSISRLLAPAKNAFDVYEEILRKAKHHGRGKLVLLALGPTATVLANDLSTFDIRAIDIGHIDVEYEWFLSGVADRVSLKNKFVNETADGTHPKLINDGEYEKQIIEEVG